jgi:hypothetical protein
LDAPGVVDERRVLAALSDGELAADRRRAAIVQRGFGEQPAGVAGAGLCDLADPSLASRVAHGRAVFVDDELAVCCSVGMPVQANRAVCWHGRARQSP